jgi:hypothetical protein
MFTIPAKDAKVQRKKLKVLDALVVTEILAAILEPGYVVA